MPDLTLVAKVTRPLLGLGDLNINDRSTYAVAGPVLWVGAKRWNRTQVDAPDVHGQVTTHKKLDTATDPLTIYVAGSTVSTLDTAIGTLADALFQHRFVLQLSVNGRDHQWDCEAADIDSVLYDTVHVYSRFVSITFSIPHQPIALVGAL